MEDRTLFTQWTSVPKTNFKNQQTEEQSFSFGSFGGSDNFSLPRNENNDSIHTLLNRAFVYLSTSKYY